MNKTQAHALAEKIVEKVYEQLDRDCEWIIGKEHTISLIQSLLLKPKPKR